ncbi:MAG TPA: c-type cytochrome [Xanthobacteraceae bacterium]|nr:c-type cytochrome [Xanthobacteraceae bacterium]
MRGDVLHAVSTWWRSLALGLAAVAVCMSGAFAQSTSLAEKIQTCGVCHGEDGNSKMENIPSLAGQPEFFVLNQLFLMREGVRKVDAMAPLVKDLKDADLDGLAKHYNKLAPKPSGEPIDPALVKRGAEVAAQKRCGSCHLPTLAGQEQMPRLAKQRIDYLIFTLKSYRDTPRAGADTAMSAAVAGLPDSDLIALAHYAASL